MMMMKGLTKMSVCLSFVGGGWLTDRQKKIVGITYIYIYIYNFYLVVVVIWTALIDLMTGLFMALQPRIIACGNSIAAFAMAVRFLTGPAVMAAASIAVGLRGVLLHVAIVQVIIIFLFFFFPFL